MKLRKSESGAMYIEGRTWEDSPLEIYKRVVVYACNVTWLRYKRIGFCKDAFTVIDPPIWYTEKKIRVMCISKKKVEAVRRH